MSTRHELEVVRRRGGNLPSPEPFPREYAGNVHRLVNGKTLTCIEIGSYAYSGSLDELSELCREYNRPRHERK